MVGITPMYKVLLPVDNSESRAIAQAETASNLPCASDEVTVHLLHVFTNKERADDTSPTQTKAGGMAHDRLTDNGIQTTTESRHGDPASVILDVADEREPDLILLGGRKRSPLGSALFGSVSQNVSLDATTPVVVTGDIEDQEIPTHRCGSCEEEYFTNPAATIRDCRNCGGSKVEPIA